MMEAFITNALGLSGIAVPKEDVPYLVAQLAGVGEASAMVQSIRLNDLVPILVFDPEVDDNG
ncbi:MAG: hypothetical protein ACYCVD_05240 [Desulfitobacteriaceae bacterium]